MIKLENISFNYENDILKDVNIEIDSQKVTFIVGKNGSGKSTLANIISGLVKPTTGNLYIDNELINKKTSLYDMRKKVGVVFQNPDNQIVFSRVYDDIKFTLENLKVNKEEIDSRIRKSLKAVDMEEYMYANPYSLSLGQKQRIAIASMLALEPKYIIFDEATSMLDINGKNDIYKLINYLKLKGIGLIFITNIMDELIYADDILIIDKFSVYKYHRDDVITNLNILKKHNLDVSLQLNLMSILRSKGICVNSSKEIIEEVSKL